MRTFDVYRLLAARAARESARKRSASRRLGQVSIILGAGLTLAALMLVLIGMLAFASISDRLPPVANLETFYAGENPVLLMPTRIYDRSGQHLLYTFENPDAPLAYRPISGEGGISPWMSELTVAVEDPAYWRSMWITPAALTREEAQTIPEQLVDSLLLWDAAPDFPLPLQRAILVAQMMTRYSREQVLEWYLNSVDYGHLAYGVEEAARLYLDKGADELNLAESALLIGVSQTPSLNPLDAPAAALENKDAVLAQLRQEGWITRLQYEDAAAAEIVFRAEAAASEPAAPAFINALIDQLAAEVPLQRIERGGLVIWSTLDFAAQQELTCAARVQLERIVGMENDDYLEEEGCRAARLLPTLPPGSADAYSGLLGAGLIIDPRSGEVLAYQDPFSVLNKNSSAVTYQPGSLLTPLAALTSFTRSYGPGSLVWDVPGNEPAVLAPYISADADYLGPMRLRKAIANDYVMVIAELMETLGAQDVFELSAKLGLEDLINQTPGASILFEGGGADLFDLAQAYSVFANAGILAGVWAEDGESLDLQWVRSVEWLGGVDHPLGMTQPASRSILSPALAYLVHDMLADEVSRRSTMGYPSTLNIGVPSGAKIGQVADRSQVWTIGYTPLRLGVVWMGSAEGTELDTRMPAGLWHALMQHLAAPEGSEGWVEPAGIAHVNVCDPSGLLPTDACPIVVTELFLSGNEPTSVDHLYQNVQINRETGRLATVFTPLELVEEKTFLIVPPEAQDWAEAAGLPVPPSSYDAIRAPTVSKDVHISQPEIFSYVSGIVEIQGTASGEGFSSYRLQAGAGLNPQSWLQIGETSTTRVRDGVLGVWDTNGEEGIYALRLIVGRGEQGIESATIQVTVDNTPPMLTLLTPQPGQVIELAEGAQFTLQARAEDNIGIDRLRWYVDGELAGERTQAPFGLFLPFEAGAHTVRVELTDLAGNVTDSGDVAFEIARP